MVKAVVKPSTFLQKGPRLLGTGLVNAVLLWLVLSAIALPLHLDHWPPAVFLTYLPRQPYIALGVVLAIAFAIAKQYRKLGVTALTLVLLVHSLGWGQLQNIANAGRANASRANAATPQLTLLSMNIHEQAKAVGNLVNQGVFQADILCFQEASRDSRNALIKALPDYEFYWGSRELYPPSVRVSGVTSVTGLRKERFQTTVSIEPAITGYRTFAISAQLREQPDWSEGESRQIAIANVHTTKALVFHDGWKGFITGTPSKAARHISERDQLAQWIAQQHGPVITAGDFNAPYGSVGTRLDGMQHSHVQVGSGPLLTFPTQRPLIGIDHVLGNQQIQFNYSEILPIKFSDHLPQWVSFSLRPDVSE